MQEIRDKKGISILFMSVGAVVQIHLPPPLFWALPQQRVWISLIYSVAI